MVGNKNFLVQFGNYRDDDLEDEMTGILEAYSGPLDEAREMQDKGASLDQIRLKMHLLKLEAPEIDNILKQLTNSNISKLRRPQ